MAAAALPLTSAASLADAGIETMCGVRATGLEPARRRVLLDTGEVLAYDSVVITTGLAPRRLPIATECSNVHMLRTLDDALRLRAALADARHVLVVGGGFMGSELAATCRQLDLAVTLVDPAPFPLARQLGPDVAQAVLRLQREHGVDLRCGAGVRGFETSVTHPGHVIAALLDDGSRIAADVVIVAIGSIPATGWLDGSGLDLGDGVVCDELCRAAPHVYAAGDVASWWHRGLEARLRLEHRMNATEQGIAAARNALGASIPYEPVPYMWTDLYDVKVQVWGHIGTGQACTPASGAFDAPSFTATYRRGDQTEAVLGWNAPRELRKARAQLTQLAMREAA